MSECELLLLSYDVHVGRAIATLIVSRIYATPAAAASRRKETKRSEPVTQCPIERMKEHPSSNYICYYYYYYFYGTGSIQPTASWAVSFSASAKWCNDNGDWCKHEEKTESMESTAFVLPCVALLSQIIIFIPIYLLQMWHRKCASFSFVSDVCWWDLFLSYFCFIVRIVVSGSTIWNGIKRFIFYALNLSFD